MTMTLSGDGTITGLVAGGLPDATITTDELAAGAALNNAPNSVGFRNRIINGDMRIDQRNAGASVTPVSGAYTVDRWQYGATEPSKFTVQQNAGGVNPPVGFTTYMGFTVASAYAVIASDIFYFSQQIEGFNVSDLGWGTSSAQSITVSFWVRSSIAGTYGVRVTNAGSNRIYASVVTIASTNTWEYKTLTIPGDTTGTWATNNTVGLQLLFTLAAGSNFQTASPNTWGTSNSTTTSAQTQLVGTLNATFYITGVQLEVGSVATPFERRPYGTELALCQRYFVSQGGESVYERFFNGISRITSTTLGNATFNFPVTMRAAPTLATISLSSTFLQASTPTTVAIDQATTRNITINITVASGLTASSVQEWYANNSLAPRVQLSAEL